MAGEQPAQFERTRIWEQIDSGGARPSGLTTEPFPFEVFNSQDIGPEKTYKARLGPPADVLSLDQESSYTYSHRGTDSASRTYEP